MVLVPTKPQWEADDSEENERRQRTRDKMRAKLLAGELEDRTVELSIEQRAVLTTTMPLGNVTGTTRAERDLLGRWIRQGAKIP